ncbi:16S rRNA (guanine(527)-N(7))-methyltransferase [Candidatus Syntrophocurvum alkaliphilum]|uniref:Ribosomal RNA small subunit methyltransferase G n=1 Tax=Candidatus Syntrophocurvum alkaliphilum TaxID=2293317 RepID=A0A6I6DEW5_9FIRM|nr:16S rRNA (guanine(527)-N(7))-methyltransferase RsmG [Candidatus Syntrophocurvum alkaliphilum]QGU00616.1 16S rRNA (guanine(527)-N(7))-methyltransferase [Candidatus Syntrophocurvum alkaliphilum]
MEYNVNRFKELVLFENRKHNLVSRKTVETDIDNHILDCKKLLNYKSIENLLVIDIGTGAGFPGLVLAILSAKTNFTLVESDFKKSNFLKLVIDELNLKNVNVIRERVEIVGRDNSFRENFDICTSRAVASMNIMLEYSIPLIKNTGSVFMWKGRNYRNEIETAKAALDELGSEVNNIFTYNLMEERDRAIIEVKKNKPTSLKYPRRVGIPAKRPL